MFQPPLNHQPSTINSQHPTDFGVPLHVETTGVALIGLNWTISVGRGVYTTIEGGP
jgi:hypothetical protein